MEALVNYSSEDDQEDAGFQIRAPQQQQQLRHLPHAKSPKTTTDSLLKQKNNNNYGSGNSPRGKEREREREREREKTKPMSQQQSHRSSSRGRIDEVKTCRCTKSIFTSHNIYQIPYAIVLHTYVCVCVSGLERKRIFHVPFPSAAAKGDAIADCAASSSTYRGRQNNSTESALNQTSNV
uniref:SD07644p n=1 Tax=Drosophila melanogaster TaxID=7227 RepID=Q9VXU4_DROME|eukprot:NP_727862.1 uncharacterized protein Dmel_CG6340, isoform A [Drosophila melanogaster]